MSTSKVARGLIAVITSIAMAAVVSITNAPAASAAPAPPPIINQKTLTGKPYAAAVRAFEAKAVTETLENFGMPATDAAAVLGWARNDVRAQMWADLSVIMGKDAASSASANKRTADEEAVYQWFQDQVQVQDIAAAQAAIDEYLKYSGLSPSTYLTQEPVSFGPNGTGWCNYRMPGPYADKYTGYEDPSCHTPPTLLTLFQYAPPTPSFDQFQTLGTYDAFNALLTNAAANGQVGIDGNDRPGFSAVSQGTTSAIAMGSSLAATAAAIPIARALGSSALGAATISKALFPFAARVTNTALKAAQAAGQAAVAALELAAELSAGIIVAGAVASVVFAVVDIVVTATLGLIQITDNMKLPGKLNTALTTAKSTKPDLHKRSAKADEYASMYATFLTATLPEARAGCTDSTGITVVGINEIGVIQCANAPTPPGPRRDDPYFLVTPKGSTTPVKQPTIDLVTATGEKVRVRASGNGWFVAQKLTTSGAPGATVQATQIPVRTATGDTDVYSRRLDPKRGYLFTISPSGDKALATLCAANAAACITDTLSFVQPNGVLASAKLVAPPKVYDPIVTASYAPTARVNQSTSFSASGTDANGLPINYEWSFVCEGEPVIATLTFNGVTTGPPADGCQNGFNINGGPTPPLVKKGPQTTFTWSSTGPKIVTLTATDTAGGKSVLTLPVNVIDGSQTITFPQPPNMTFAQDPVTHAPSATQKLVATASSTYPVVFAVDPATASVCTLKGVTVTATDVGTCTITATQPGSPPYSAAAPVTRSFTVGKGNYTVIVATTPGVYSNPLPTDAHVMTDLTPFAVTGTLTGCVPIGGLTDAAGNITAAPATYPLTGCSGLASPRYNITYSPTITIVREQATLLGARMTSPATAPTLVARVTPAADGTPGDLTKARVDFLIFRSTNTTTTPDFTISNVAVNAAGVAARAADLPTGRYKVLTRMSSATSYYTAAPVATGVFVPLKPGGTRRPVAVR